MADKKISQLTNASTPLAGTEVLPIVQSGSTVKVASDNLTVKNVRSNATTGILQIAGPAAAATRTMTVPDANFTAARTDAGQTFTGVQIFTSPKVITSLDDTNGNELFKFTATASAVNELTVANAATGNRPTISATGDDTDIGIALTPKGTGDTRITAGNFLLSASTASPAGTPAQFVNQWFGGAKWGASFDQTASSAISYTHINFSTAGVAVGSIGANNTATTYNTSSDRRLKDNIAPADDAGSVIDAIEIVKHDWKVGGSVRYGVIAQDLHEVAPEAVAAGDDGEEIEKTWGVDYSKLVPMLIKEVQSLRKRVAELEAK